MLQLLHWIVDYPHPKGYRIAWPSGKTHYTLLLFHHPLTVWENGKPVMTRAQTCVLYPPGMPQLYYNDEAGYTHDGVFFKGEEAAALLAGLPIEPGVLYAMRNPAAVASLIRDIAAEAILKERYSPAMIDCLLRGLLYKLADQILHGESAVRDDYLAFFQLRREIFARPAEPWPAKRLSEEQHLSLSRFQHLYRQFFGTTLGQDVIRSRVEHAQYRLRSTTQPVYEVAAACGYHNVEHFCRQFRRYTGVTPGAYREGKEAGIPSSDKEKVPR